MACHACGQNVPAGAFCGECGATLSPQRGDGPGWLRIRAFAAAPDEHLVRPNITSSIFPQLPRRSRTAFRVGLIGLVVLLTALAWLRLEPPLIGISALGFALLFLVYLSQTGGFRDVSIAALTVSSVLGVGLGIGWAVATDAIWSRTYDDVLGTPMTPAQALINLLVIPVIGVLLMLLPVAVVRVWRPGVRESLDGFTIGALGALSFTVAGVLTRGAPEFANGLWATDYPLDALFALAAIRGVAGPLTAAAVGGMVGAALWFRPRTNPETVRHWYSLTSPLPAITFALLAYVAQNAIDFAWISYGAIVALYAAIAVLAVIALRAVLQCTLLGEASDGLSPTQPVLCPQCDHVVPDRAFCVNCGITANAASRSSRRTRRATRPVSIDLAQDTTPQWPGQSIPGGPYRAPAPRHTSLLRLALLLGTASAIVMATTVGLALWITPAPANYACPPDCGRPPIGQPVTINPRFTPDDGGFSVSYPGPATAYEATLESDGVVLELHAGDGGTLHLFAEPAAGRTPRQIADQLISNHFPDATTAYEIPNAQVGYQPGFGAVIDVYKPNAGGGSARLRVLVMVAVKHDLALIAEGAGPYREFTPDFGSGHPSGANFFLALDMGKYVNSFMWRGDPPR
jgi:hypothetical protein